MKITKNISVSPERVVQYAITATYLSMLIGCKGQPGPDALETVTPDANAINAKRQRAIDTLGQDAKYLGDPLSSFKVNIPAEPDGSKPASTVSGTIFEVKTEFDTTLQASNLTLGLYVPDKGAPTPVLINHISDDPNSLVQTTVQEDGGITTERYGIAAMPLDEQYLEAFIKGDVEINGPVDQFLKKNARGDIVPLYTILFNDITPDNVKSFVEELSQLEDPAKIQEAVLSRIYGVTFSDLATDRSIIIRLNNQNQNNIKEFIANLFFGSDMVAQAKGLSAAELTAQAPTPFEAPTPIPTPTPIEVAPGEFIPASQIVGYEARDNSGKLIYVQDINGKWIKASYEVAVPTATAEDWANVNARLGTDFVINTDGTISGVEGLNINMTNGEATFNFDGKGVEAYHIGNIKVQEINGVKTLLVAGYAWNPESKSWEVFNPGFPMESPEAQLGWFIQADVAIANWLRFHQRALEVRAISEGFVNANGSADMEKYMKYIFEGTLPTYGYTWGLSNISGSAQGVPGSIVNYDKLDWQNDQIDVNDRSLNGILKALYPGRGGLSSSYLIDGKSFINSFDVLDGPSLAMIMDDVLWAKEHRSDIRFTRLALASGHEWDLSMVKENEQAHRNDTESWMVWPIVRVDSSETISSNLGQSDIEILKNPQDTALRLAAIKDNRIDQSASLVVWGATVLINPGN